MSKSGNRCSPEDFISAARRILDRDGHYLVTARNISKESGRSAMALYRHFGSMEHLIASLWNSCYGELNEMIWGDWDHETGRGSDGRDRPAQIAHCFRLFVRYMQEYPNRFWFMFSLRADPEKYEMPNHAIEGYQHVVRLLQLGAAAGDFLPDLDPMRATMKLGQRLLGFSFQVAPTAPGAMIGYTPQEILDEVIGDLLAELCGTRETVRR